MAQAADRAQQLVLRDQAAVQHILDLVRAHMGMSVAFVSEFVEGRRVFRTVSADAATSVVVGGGHALEDTYCRLIVDRLIAEVIPDASAEPMVRDLVVTRELGIGSYVGCPIVLSDGTLYGTLCAFSATPDPKLTERDARLVQLTAGLVAERVEEQTIEQVGEDAAGARVRRALAAGDPTIVYQPIVDLGSGSVVGMEALSRFVTLPPRPPDEWFYDGILSGLAIELEVEAVRRALVGLNRLADAVYLTVNVSQAVLGSPELREALDEVSPERVVIELTEHELIEDMDAALATVRGFRQRGFRLSVDDVGAGYAGLTQLLDLKPDIVKLDQLIIRGVVLDASRQAMIAAAIEFARSVGAVLVAEGIQTESELDTLRSLGVAFGQGYYLGRPGPIRT